MFRSCLGSRVCPILCGLAIGVSGFGSGGRLVGFRLLRVIWGPCGCRGSLSDWVSGLRFWGFAFVVECLGLFRFRGLGLFAACWVVEAWRSFDRGVWGC